MQPLTCWKYVCMHYGVVASIGWHITTNYRQSHKSTSHLQHLLGNLLGYLVTRGPTPTAIFQSLFYDFNTSPTGLKFEGDVTIPAKSARKLIWTQITWDS